ncbi:hypothetical protein GCM10023094_25100 [Rhodococcus olei]|uniref:Uncharacterized protein n=1 Tax=Rhodococcus olei TaxID=2161675 RepID=A0ABP8P3P0_9NOCA
MRDADGFVEYVARAAVVSSEAAQDSVHAPAAQQFRGREDHRRSAGRPIFSRGHRAGDHRYHRREHVQRARLTAAEVLPESRRNQVRAAIDVLAELDALSTTIG